MSASYKRADEAASGSSAKTDTSKFSQSVLQWGSASSGTRLGTTNKPGSSSSSSQKRKSGEDLTEVDNDIARFFISCNVLFANVDSREFKDMCWGLQALKAKPDDNPPSTKRLKTTLLDKEVRALEF